MRKLFICIAAAAMLCTAAAYGGLVNGTADLALGQPDLTHGSKANSKGIDDCEGIAVDNSIGKIYVSDRNNSRVLWWDSLSSLMNGKAADGVLGQPDLYSNVTACTQTGMSFSEGLCVDGAGNLWVVDSGNYRVLKFARPATSGEPALLVLCQPNFTTRASGTSQTAVTTMTGIHVDTAGNVWVTDFVTNSRVLKFVVPIQNGQASEIVLPG